MSRAPRVGVLALQGDVVEHLRALEDVGASSVPVKTVADLSGVGALIVPGGETTTVMKLLERFDLAATIRERVAAGMPFWGTCMGMIVAAREVAGDSGQATLNLLDIAVRRNAFGRQAASAEVDMVIPALGAQPFPAIFIRAPWVERVGPSVRQLASLDGHAVLVQQKHVLGSAFHPEMTADRRLHEYFLKMVERAATIGKQSPAA